MYDVANAGRPASEQSTDQFHNGATFMNALIDPNSMTLNPYFCYLTKWSQNCMVKPITYHPRAAAWIDEFGDTHDDETNSDIVPYSQYPWHGIIPNSCCGIKPYNSDIRCCDPVTQKLHSRCHDFDEDEEPADGIIMEHTDHRTAEQIDSDSVAGGQMMVDHMNGGQDMVVHEETVLVDMSGQGHVINGNMVHGQAMGEHIMGEHIMGETVMVEMPMGEHIVDGQVIQGQVINGQVVQGAIMEMPMGVHMVDGQVIQGQMMEGHGMGEMVMGEMTMDMAEMVGHTSKREAEFDYEGYDY